MKETPDVFPAATLRDAYKVKGFRVRARIDSYDELEHPAFVLTWIGAQKTGVRRLRDALPERVRQTLAAGSRPWLRRPGGLSRFSDAAGELQGLWREEREARVSFG
jgi:hypothetical protein